MGKAKTVAIKYAPNETVKNLKKVSRNGNKYTVTWSYPSDATSKKNNRRWEGVAVVWEIKARNPKKKTVTVTEGKGKKAKKIKKQVTDYKVTTIRHKLGTNKSSDSITVDLGNYYPFKAASGYCYLDSVTATVYPYNKKNTVTKGVIKPATKTVKKNGKNKKQPVQSSTTYSFAAPARPAMGCSFNKDTQVAIGSVYNSELGPEATAHRAKTQWWMFREDSTGVTANNKYVGGYKQISTGEVDTALGKNLTISKDPGIGIQGGLKQGQWIRIKWEAYNKGVYGDSSKNNITHVYAYPARAEIKSIAISPANAIKKATPTGTVSIAIETNHKATAPVDQVKLQRLIDCEWDEAYFASLEDGWENVEGAVGDKNCRGLSDNIEFAVSKLGLHTWYRLITFHDNFQSISEPVEATALFRKMPSVADATVDIVNIESERDGESLKCQLAWDVDTDILKHEKYTGNEISWSTKDDAWISTSQPSTFQAPWTDVTPNNKPTSKVPGYMRSADVVIRDLTPGERYFVKARRYMEAHGEVAESQGMWNPPKDEKFWPAIPMSTITEEQLATVQLYVQQPIIRGQDTSASWTYESEAVQTRWELIAMRRDPETKEEISSNVIADGNDAMNSTVIKSDIFENDSEISFKIRIYVGNMTAENTNDIGSGEGNDRTYIKIVDKPKPVQMPNMTIVEQPFKFALNSLTGTENYLFSITADELVSCAPDGEYQQVQDDIVYSQLVSPSWEQNASGTYDAVITIPEGTEFRDGSRYTLHTTVIDTDHNLRSEETTSTIAVAWAHQAIQPSSESKVVANPHSSSVTITPIAPEGAIETDVCDIYRMTPDGADIIVRGVPFGSAVTDRFAPYSKLTPLFYRLVLRTKDGDVEWLDIPYNLNGYTIRFDWGGTNSLEIPYNLKYSDAYTKDFEARQHLDGDTAGYWNDSVGHTKQTNSDLVRLDDVEQQLAVKEMARYPGAIFVRYPDGSAFMANVDVSNMDNDYSSLVMPITLAITEVAITDEFRVDEKDIIRPVTAAA